MNAFTNFFLNPISKGRLQFLFVIFIFVFFTVFIYFHHKHYIPEIFPDTPTYYRHNLINPWASGRTPMVGLFAEFIGVDTKKINHMNNMSEDECKKIVLAYTFLYAMSLSILACILCTLIPPAVCMSTFACCMVTKIPPPNNILAEQLTFVCCVVFLISCIAYFKSKRTFYLFFLCLISVIACLVKPVCFFLSGVSALVILASIFSDHYKMLLCKTSIFIFLVAGTLIWPVWLYINSGFFVVSQLSITHSAIFAMHFVQRGDESMFNDPKNRQFVLRMIEEREKNLPDPSPRPFDNYTKMRNIYGYRLIPKIHREVYGRYLTKSLHRITAPIVRKHIREHLKHIRDSFVSSFDSKISHTSSFFMTKLKVPFLAKYWHIIMIMVITCASLLVFFSHNNSSRLRCTAFSVVVCALLHIFHVLVSSVGHMVLTRYLEITEFFFLLSFSLSVYIISLLSLRKMR